MTNEERVLTLEEVRTELSTWMVTCRDGDFKGSPEKLLRLLSQWAEDNAVPTNLV